MFFEVVNFDEVQSGEADIEIECDEEFINFAKNHTGKTDVNEAVKNFVTESILEYSDKIEEE